MWCTNSSSFLVCSRLQTESFIDKWRPNMISLATSTLNPALTSQSVSFECCICMCVVCVHVYMPIHMCGLADMHVYEHGCGGQRSTSVIFPSLFPTCILSQDFSFVPRAQQVRLVELASLYWGIAIFVPCAWITSGPVMTMNNLPISLYWRLNF